MTMTIFRSFVAASLLLLAGCDRSEQAQPTVLEGKTMGTFWRVSLVDIDAQRAQALQQKIQAQLDADDRLM